jgi:hypothetical protein
MYEAAQNSGQRPEDLSFVHAVRVLNRRLPEAATVPPEQWENWRTSLLAEIARCRAVQSRGKSNPRGVKRKMSNFRIRRPSEPLNQRITSKIVIK